MSHLAPATQRGRAPRQKAIARNVATIDTAAMVENISAAYRIATDKEIAEGLAWYPTAHAIAGDRAGAGMLAALSVGTSWPRNVELFHAMRDAGDCRHAFGDPIRKARAIRDGADPSDVLRGRKVRSFYANVADPWRAGAVTIDRHAYSIALLGIDPTDTGRRTATLAEPDLKALERPGIYAVTAGAYRSVARRVGLRPHELQAVVWIVWRDRHAFDTGNSRGYLTAANHGKANR